MERYAEITHKNPREILLLRGSGCRWKRCAFCDYHLDFSPDEDANYALNRREIQKVTGKYRKLEVINSGSFVDLDRRTMELLRRICVEKLYPVYRLDERVDILLQNTDFGVGGEEKK